MGKKKLKIYDRLSILVWLEKTTTSFLVVSPLQKANAEESF